MVKRYHESFPSFSYGFNSRYPLQISPFLWAIHYNRCFVTTPVTTFRIIITALKWTDYPKPNLRELCPKVGDGLIRRRFELA